MKPAKIALLIIALTVIVSICTWMLRGEYDKHLMMEGHFHVVNAGSQDYDVVLKFPSGEQAGFILKNGGSYDFRVPDTGEGSITVMLDGETRDQVGYVTTMNSIVILVIGEEQTVFSQIFPSLSTEQGNARDAASPRP